MAASYSYQIGERQLIYHRNQVFTSMDALLIHLKNKGFTPEMIGKILDRIQPTTEVIMKQYLRDAGYSLADVNNLMTPLTEKTTAQSKGKDTSEKPKQKKATEAPKQSETKVTQDLSDSASPEKKPAATAKKKTTTKTTKKSTGRKKSSAKRKTSAAAK